MNIPKNPSQGKCYIVATPIGHLDDMTHRAIQTLTEVSTIFAEDTRVSQKLLQHFGIHKKLQSLHDHNEAERAPQILARVNQGESVAIISDAGTPLISDPGYRVVSHLRDEGVEVVPVPGASAVIAALSCVGLPTDAFYFGGFLSTKSEARKKALTKADAQGVTLVFYESVHRVNAMLEDLAEVVEESRQVAVCRELTKTYETILVKPIKALIEGLQSESWVEKGEFVIVVAPKPKADETGLSAEEEKIAALLADELPVKKAASLAAKITGNKKNTFYNWLIKNKS